MPTQMLGMEVYTICNPYFDASFAPRMLYSIL